MVILSLHFSKCEVGLCRVSASFFDEVGNGFVDAFDENWGFAGVFGLLDSWCRCQGQIARPL